MRKFLLSMALVLLTGATMAQGTNDGRLTADDLNAKTEKTAILIKCTQETNYTTYYNPTGRGALGENSIVYWVPAGEGAFYITKGDGENDYMQTSGITAFGSQATAAKFYAVKPYGTGSGVESFAGANCYEDEATGGEYWVRLAFTDNSKWFNFNGNTYNTGTGVWTVQNIYEVVTITYNIKYNDATRLTVKTAGIVGNDFPEIPASSLPLGVTVTKPEGKVSAEGTFDLEATVSVPFEYADSYENITKWYKMGIRDDAKGPSYLKYDETKAYIPTPGTYDNADKLNFAWAFIGDPFTGFEIVNNAAGETMVLSAPSAPTANQNAAELARMVTKNDATGNTSWAFKNTTHNNAKAGAFYIEHPTAATYAFNRQDYNSESTLCYWNKRDTGSSIWVEEPPIGAVAELEALVAEAETLLGQIEIGTGIGKYSSSYDNYEAAYTEIVAYSQNIPATATEEDIQEKINELQAIIASFSLNMPEKGKYYRFKDCDSENYMLSDEHDATHLAMGNGELASAIFYYGEDGSLLSYANGCYLPKAIAQGDWTCLAVGVAGPAATFGAGSAIGTYGFYVGDDSSRAYYSGRNTYVDAGGTIGSNSGYDWILEEVESLPVTVTSAGYATLYAPVALNVPPGVTAHTVTLNGEWATLSEALEVIPTNTGVVLAGEGSYNFEITTAAAFEGKNALEGTVAAEYKAEDAYVLSYIDTNKDGVKDEVGFYTATKNQNDGVAFLNNSHKAYLPKTAGMNAVSYSFRFGEGTTGISEVKGESGNVKGIYDLTGRRVENISAPGIYIVGGKKVLVK